MTKKDATVAFRVEGADSSKQEVEKIRKAVEDFGDEGKKAAQKLIDPLTNIERDFDKLEKKITSGKNITTKDIGAMTQQFSFLENQIEETFGSIEKAPVAMQQAFARAQQQVSKATSIVREATDAAKDHKNKLDEAGGAWAGFGGTLEQMFPKLGSIISGLGSVSAALTAGIAIGAKFVEFTGGNYDELKRKVNDFGLAVGRATNELHDSVVAAATGQWLDMKIAIGAAGQASTMTKDELIGLKVALKEGDTSVSGMNSSLKQLRNETEALAKIGATERTATNASTEISKAWAQAKRDAAGDVKKLAAATDEINGLVELHSKLLGQGAIGQKVWADLNVHSGDTAASLGMKLKALGIDVNDVAKHFDTLKLAQEAAKSAHESWATSLGKAEESAKKLTASVAADESALTSANIARKKAESEVNGYSETLKLLTPQLDAARDAQAAAAATYGEGSGAARDAASAVSQLEADIRSATAGLDAARAAVAAKTSEEQKAAAAVAQHSAELAKAKTAINDNSNEVYALVKALDTEVSTRRVLSGEQKQQAERLKELADNGRDLTDADGHIDEQLQSLLKAYTELTLAVTKQSNAQGEVSETSALEQNQVRKELETLGAAIEARLKNTAAMEAGTTAADTASAANDKLTDATRKSSQATSDGSTIHAAWSDATKAGQKSADDAASTLNRMKEAQTGVSTEIGKGKAAADSGTTAMKSLSDTAGGMVEPLKKGSESLGHFASPEILDGMRQLHGIAKMVADELTRIETQGHAAAAAMKAFVNAANADGAADQ